ncbi:MAG TPA: hypothetical protein VN937_16305 [Blastocatellia bacterium]|nr:hypothetical protein [Blastocatellia bacterium]
MSTIRASEAPPIEETAESTIVPEPVPSAERPQDPYWPQFLNRASDVEIRARFSRELNAAVQIHEAVLSSYCCLALLEAEDNIDSFEADRIYKALSETNSGRDKDVLLIILSGGGSIEPAYQISKICKSFAKNRFIAVIPRRAKSAATLIALGADEIHIGPLGQLGPIDPQLDGLPALGVTQALERLASVAEKHPGSAEMFAAYLQRALTIQQIGYCDRIAESAAQYAERLLSTKVHLVERAGQIARELVYEYKHHGFVIDLAEATTHLGSDWIKGVSPELALAETVYSHFEDVDLWLGMVAQKRIIMVGELKSEPILLKKERR